MADYRFDKVVIGAGMAGLCCAGELVRNGERPLLISETKEVGANFAVEPVGDQAFGICQFPTQFVVRERGGWWFELFRSLNVPLRLHQGPGVALTVRGSGELPTLPVCPTPSGLAGMIVEIFPPLADSAKVLERIFEAALAIPHSELIKMDQVPLEGWLEEQGADEFVSMILLALLALANEIETDVARQHLSVFGGVICLRALFLGDAIFSMPYPNIREGMCIPLANEIEQRGGTVWKGRQVQQVLVEDGKVVGVLMKDGTRVEAPVVAIAAGNPRIPKILDPLPVEAQAPLAYGSHLTVKDYTVYTVLDKPLVNHNQCVAVLLDMATAEVHWSMPLQGVAPWLTPPGTQLLLSHKVLTPERLAEIGGEDALFADLAEIDEELYPGFKDASGARSVQTHTHHWLSPVSIGPKLPRSIESVQGLWFVGDGSSPCAGIWMEAAASCGILGARAILGQPIAWSTP